MGTSAPPIEHAELTLAFSSMSDEEARECLQRYQIGLTVDEARKVQEMLGRPPTLTEAVIWGIQGSEHCSYKSSRHFLSLLPTSGKHVILGPKEDSGIVAMTDGPPGKRWGIVISHESHNHPSQIVPYEGAATGVGGTVRDVACMGARVIGCMDMLRLGDLQSAETRAIAKEVGRGIAGYGNPLGIPNLGGDTVFDASFNRNCLVNAIAVGLVREDEIIHSFVPEEAGRVGYDILIVGKPTDRSGFGGAAFASLTMEEEKRAQNVGAVQEPNPFLERHLLSATYALFDWLAQNGKLSQVSFKDLGAGGVVCSTVEQVAARTLGAEINLDLLHAAMPGLQAEVLACAETQERFCWICHPDLTAHILQHYNEAWALPEIAENARASVIGKVTEGDQFRITHKGKIVCDAPSGAITSGLQYDRPREHAISSSVEPIIRFENGSVRLTHGGREWQFSLPDIFRAMLRHPNYASSRAFTLHYDKNVMGNTIFEAGEADASVIAPLQELSSYVQGGERTIWEIADEERFRGIALSADGNPRYGRISARLQGAMAVSESICNVSAVGAVPRALTDCLNYGNPEIPLHLGALEEGVRGIAEAANGIRVDGEPVPVISGNVSLYNSTPDGNAIPPSAIVCCIGVLRDARNALPMRFQKRGSRLFLLGERKDECGGSAYYAILEKLSSLPHDSLLGQNVPEPDFAWISRCVRFLSGAAKQHLLLSSHDISDGGMLLSLFEMTVAQRKLGGEIGADIDLQSLESVLRPDVLLLSQTPGFIVEAEKKHMHRLLELSRALDLPLHPLGKTTGVPELTVRSGSRELLTLDLPPLQHLWSTSLQNALVGH